MVIYEGRCSQQRLREVAHVWECLAEFRRENGHQNGHVTAMCSLTAPCAHRTSMNTHQHTDDHLLTPQEAADMLSLSPATLAGWRSDPRRAPQFGGPPFVRIGTGKRATIRYRRSDLDTWVERLIEVSA